MEDIIKYLLDNNQTISVMESCTGGLMASSITDIPNASLVFKFGATTYSNEYKIKFGFKKKLIDKYTVYSMEVARDMAYAIVNYTSSDYGIGITGKLNKQDINNLDGDVNKVYIAIYDKKLDKYYIDSFFVNNIDRFLNKKEVVHKVVEKMRENLL